VVVVLSWWRLRSPNALARIALLQDADDFVARADRLRLFFSGIVGKPHSIPDDERCQCREWRPCTGAYRVYGVGVSAALS
jgi:hypothetical protein